ncbi:hypothetical protein [Paraburkholderia sp. HD33-4]|uniref:hypothetical protein n=1 Tax=Paraburkholderia sp. HD33-4 TaxID=2883242 RepID=UPI001F3C65EA|nr:hypothetical protein [Paraburkholderia sp. HD33-4]
MDWTVFVKLMMQQIEAGKREQAERDAVLQKINDRARRIREARLRTMAAKREKTAAKGAASAC